MKTKHLFFVLTGLFIMLIFSSCEDLISKNLKKKDVNVLSPADGVHLTTNSVVFWWDEVKGAENYNIQIVQPSFAAVQTLKLDSNVVKNRFSFTLLPGTYEWRVKAQNNASATAYITRTLYVDSTSDLSTQSVAVSSPPDNYSTKTAATIFTWDNLYSATDYRIQIINQSSNATIADALVQVNTYSYTLTEGTFKWQVRAQNAHSNSPFSTRTITIDLTPPAVSAQSYPKNDSTVTTPVTLKWIRNAGAVGDSLFIYSDSLISPPVYQSYTTDTTYSFSGTATEDYFWRLKSADAAGNFSAYGSLFKFILQ